NGLGSCRAGNIAIFFPLTAGSLGYAYALAGRPTEAISLLEQSAERLTEMHIVMNHSIILCWLSEACLLAGHIEKANACGELALNLARENKEKGHYAWACACRESWPRMASRRHRAGLGPLLPGDLACLAAGYAPARRPLPLWPW